jgi:hypothetical protein
MGLMAGTYLKNCITWAEKNIGFTKKIRYDIENPINTHVRRGAFKIYPSCN